MSEICRLTTALLLFAAAGVASQPARSQTAITTYHVDQGRTGWNPAETVLTTANAGSLQLQQSVTLDGQVDAEPLLVPGVNLGTAGVHDVLYVATENDTVYGLDAATGAVLLQTSLGTPVPETALPGGCDNNDVVVGINSTPVIDRATSTLYVIAYSFPGGVQTFTLHALNIATLADRVAPVTIGETAKLAGHGTYSFNAAVNRQRSALLLANGNVYAGFAAFCDDAPDTSRGWVMGWHESNLKSLGPHELLDRRAAAPEDQFLNEIWMSGYGLAADATGSIYFATGNSDMSGKSWSKKLNLSDSVVRMAANLKTVEGFYTPTDPGWGQKADDMDDGDVGSGGVLVLPTQPGALPNLAVLAGKKTPILVLNRDNLGGRGNNQVTSAPSGSCWCGQSYFTGADGVGRVVTSTGQAVTVFTLQTLPSVALINPVSGPNQPDGQDAGFFTSVSSNGTIAGSAVVWSVSRPASTNPGTVNLYAIDPNSGAQLFEAAAGTWPDGDANANLVPTVANGRVYVASYKQLTIFGLGTPSHPVALAQPAAPAIATLPGAPHVLTGHVTAIGVGGFTLQLRDGRRTQVVRGETNRPGWLRVGAVAKVRGDFGQGGFVAHSVLRAKHSEAVWAEDK
jgi:hypothetical protein